VAEKLKLAALQASQSINNRGSDMNRSTLLAAASLIFARQANIKNGKRPLAALSAMLALSLLAAAQAQTLPTVEVFIGTLKAGARSDRVAAAHAMLKHVEFVSSTLPTMRPSEREWLAQESAAIGDLKDDNIATERRLQFFSSVEFQHSKIDYITSNVREALRCVIQERVTLRHETYCWSAAAYHMSDPDLTYAIRKLRKAGRMSKVNLVASGQGPVPVDDDDSLAFLYGKGARNIQEAIVLPYLRGDLR
jgi:hypothetical protein